MAGSEHAGSLASLNLKPDEQNLIVAMRIRPMGEEEIIMGATPIAHKVDDKMVVLMDPMEDPDDILRANRSREKQYMFDYAFDGSCCQKEVYEKTSKALIPSVINGYNATVFAYGATGAGKTYTMLGTDEDPGIMAHVLHELFCQVEKGKDHLTYSVSLSYLEIYNEMIRDLLNPTSGYLDLREDSKGVQVSGLSEFSAQTSEEVMDILHRGNKERTQEPTKANKESSRSHAVLQICVQQKDRMRDFTQQVRTGKFFMIDLAGSERAANTQNRGKRLVEGAHINRSLLALGNCINALGSDKNKLKYVNYRDSKLTRLLKDSLGGNCKTVMIAHISPAHFFFEESRNTLVYADRAKNIRTKVRQNVADITYHLSQYQNIIHDLKEEIKRLHRKLEHTSQLRSNQGVAQSAEASRQDKQTALGHLKQQLVESFTEQMELRRNLMDLNNATMEISLETFQNQNIINKWEKEKEILLKKQADAEEAKYREDEKRGGQFELSLGGSPVEPDEVVTARNELATLQADKISTEKLRINVQRELSNARSRASKIEKSIPELTNDSDHQEILQLLCKVHELEIDNLEMQSSCLLRNFEISKRDMALSIYHHHRQLAHEIINQQREVLQDNNIECPPQLDDLYEAYQLECGKLKIERNLSLPEIQLPPTARGGSHSVLHHHRLLTTSTSDVDRLSTVDETDKPLSTHPLNLPKIHTPVSLAGGGTGANSVARKRVLKNASMNLAKYEVQEEKIFSPSAKTKEIQEARRKNRLFSPNAQSVDTMPKSQKDNAWERQKSIVTLSTPTSDVSQAGRISDSDNKDVISRKTRGIARVAASKRMNKSQVNASNAMKKSLSQNRTPFSSDRHADDEGSVYLSQSRLADHNQVYTPNLTPDPYTERRHQRQLYRPENVTAVQSDPSVNKSRSYHSHDRALYQQLSKASIKRTSDGMNENSPRYSSTMANKRSQRSLLPLASKSRRNKALALVPQARPQVHMTKAEVDFNSDFLPGPDKKPAGGATDRAVKRKKRSKTQGKTNQKQHDSYGALTLDDDKQPSDSDTKKANGTIPVYKKGDISVRGLALQ